MCIRIEIKLISILFILRKRKFLFLNYFEFLGVKIKNRINYIKTIDNKFIAKYTVKVEYKINVKI
jgi:hypothetical protein